MGNICRSPSAEGFFRFHADREGLLEAIHLDSAGTHGYHVGHPPDARAIAAMTGRGADISGLRARRVRPEDFHDFDLVVAMDEVNHARLEQLAAQAGETRRARLVRMMSYAPQRGVREVPDPYYGDERNFEHMCDLLDDATRGLLDEVRATLEQGTDDGRSQSR
jgi:protein-tyrosine phosphatase